MVHPSGTVLLRRLGRKAVLLPPTGGEQLVLAQDFFFIGLCPQSAWQPGWSTSEIWCGGSSALRQAAAVLILSDSN